MLASELINLTDFSHGEVTGLFTMCPQYPGTLITNLATQQLKSLLYLAALPLVQTASLVLFAISEGALLPEYPRDGQSNLILVVPY